MYKNLELFDKIMKQANIFYWVGEGTALGFIREGGIIKGDTDVDIGMYYENKEKYYKKGLPLLLSNGFKIMRGGFNLYGPHSVIRNNCYIDVDFIGKGFPCMTYEWPHIPDDWIHLIEPFQKKTIRNVEYVIPSINYIKFLYGDDYMTPKKNFKPIHNKRNLHKPTYHNIGQIKLSSNNFKNDIISKSFIFK